MKYANEKQMRRRVLGELSRACCLADSAGLCKDLETRWHNSCRREQQENREREEGSEGAFIIFVGQAAAKAKQKRSD